MQLRVVNPNTQIYSPNFDSNMRYIKPKNGRKSYWTTTYFFRSGFAWDDFIQLLGSKYKNTKKVHIIDHACSNGPEANTLVILLMEKFQQQAKKFFPIIAKDYDASNIKMAKRNAPITVDYMEANKIDLYTSSIMKYFDIVVNSFSEDGGMQICAKPIVRQNIQFFRGDIFQDIDRMPKSNTVLLCRNMMIYLNENEQKALVDKICSHFDESSLIVVGEYDLMNTNIDEMFKKNSFARSRIEGIFYKKKQTTPLYQQIAQCVHNLKNKIQKLIHTQALYNKD